MDWQALRSAAPAEVTTAVQALALEQGAAAAAPLRAFGLERPGVRKGLAAATLMGAEGLADALGLDEVAVCADYLNTLSEGLPQEHQSQEQQALAAADTVRALRVLAESEPPSPPEVTAALLERLVANGALARIARALSGPEADAEEPDDAPADWTDSPSLLARALGDLSLVLGRLDDPEPARLCALALADGLAPEPLREAVLDCLAHGKGASLAAFLPDPEPLLTSGAERLLQQAEPIFADAQAALSGLGALLAGFAPLVPREALARAAAAYLDEHGDVLRAFLVYAAAMASDAALVPDATDLLASFPVWSTTATGAPRVARALCRQARGQSTYLDRLLTMEGLDPVEVGAGLVQAAFVHPGKQGLAGLRQVQGQHLLFGEGPEWERFWAEPSAQALDGLGAASLTGYLALGLSQSVAEPVPFPAFLEGLLRGDARWGGIASAIDLDRAREAFERADDEAGWRLMGQAALTGLATEAGLPRAFPRGPAPSLAPDPDALRFLEQLVPADTPEANLPWLLEAPPLLAAAPEHFARLAAMPAEDLKLLLLMARDVQETLGSLPLSDPSDPHVGKVYRWFGEGGLIDLDEEGKEARLFLRDPEGGYSLRLDADPSLRSLPPQTLPELTLAAVLRSGAAPEPEVGGKYGGTDYLEVYPVSAQGIWTLARLSLPAFFQGNEKGP